LRIGLDVRYLSHGLLGGVHTYVYQVVRELAQLQTSDQFFLYADTKRPFELEGLPANFTVRYLPWRNKLDSAKADLAIAKLAAQDRLDVFHFPANYGFGPKGVPTVITLHDALNIFPLWEATKRDLKRPKTVAQTLYLQAMTRLSLRRAAGLITVSEHAAQNIVEVSRGKIPRSKLTVIHSAQSSDFRRINDTASLEEARTRLQLPPKFLLADGLKNPGVILRAWELLPKSLRNEYRLIFFSRRPDLLPIAMKAIQEGRVRHILRPSTEDLIALYNLAELFLFPSWIEGFGLPILEAMACGAPVIASDRGSIPEVGGEAALYHDAEDEGTLARYIEQLLTTPEERHKIQQRGFERAAQFSWSRTAQQHLETYYQLKGLQVSQLHLMEAGLERGV
jgi:glycosyltransferase involved in cell wall biosynthesis